MRRGAVLVVAVIVLIGSFWSVYRYGWSAGERAGGRLALEKFIQLVHGSDVKVRDTILREMRDLAQQRMKMADAIAAPALPDEADEPLPTMSQQELNALARKVYRQEMSVRLHIQSYNDNRAAIHGLVELYQVAYPDTPLPENLRTPLPPLPYPDQEDDESLPITLKRFEI